MKTAIEAKDISIRYETSNCDVLHHVSFQIHDGEHIAIIGNSGSGKTTLLRALAGLTPIFDGKISWNLTPASGVALDTAIVFQNDTLLPWQTIEKNIWFSIKRAKPKLSKQECKELAEIGLNRIGLWEHRKKYPNQLSGGMRQRTAFIRGLLMETPLLLLDEPFSALDTSMREILFDYLIQEITKKKQTVMMVTHDHHEASAFGNRILKVENENIYFE